MPKIDISKQFDGVLDECYDCKYPARVFELTGSNTTDKIYIVECINQHCTNKIELINPSCSADIMVAWNKKQRAKN